MAAAAASLVTAVADALHMLPGTRPGRSFKRSDDENSVHTWREVSGTTFDVRKGPKYAVNKEKAASKHSLYECVAVDFFHSAQKRENVAAGVHLPSGEGRHEEEEKELGIPANFVVTLNMPNYAPPNPVWGKSKEDGDGYTMVLYFVLSEPVRKVLLNGHVSVPAVDLLKAFINAPEGSPLRQRFKGIARVVNLPDVPLNGLVKKLVNSYNATPFLIRTTSTFHRGPNYFEICVDVHRFSYMALVGLNGIKDKLADVIADLAFVVQAEEDYELPEQILGCVRLRKIQLKQSHEFPESHGAAAPPAQAEPEQ